MLFPKSLQKFLLVNVIFIILAKNYGTSQTIDEKNFRIDTLKASYVSGSPATGVIGKIYLSFKIPAGNTAKLLMKTNPTGAYASLGTFGEISSTAMQTIRFIVPNLNIRTDIYCFYLELKSGNATLVTKELCSISFIKDAAKNDTTKKNNRINFQVGSYQPGTKTPFQRIRAYITGKCISDLGCNDDIDDFATSTKNVAPYRAPKEYGAEIKCGEIKVFEVTIDVNRKDEDEVFIDNGMVSISDTIRNTGNTTQEPKKLVDEHVYATVEKSKVKLIWRNDETRQPENKYIIERKFIIERKEGLNGNYTLLPTKNELERGPGSQKTTWELIDQTSKPEKNPYFYRIKYEDYCANLSPITDVAPIFLQQDKKTFDLNWSSENNEKVGDYEVEYFDIPSGDPANTLLIQPKSNTFDTETANFYRIRGKQVLGDGNYIFSNLLPNDENLTVLNPTVFTPDGKGPPESEIFRVFTEGETSFYIAIYNRQGLLVYFSEDYKTHGWDGKLIYTDIDLPEDVYAFQVEVKNSNKRNFTKRGSIVLVRD
jgi:hypothetical protein